MTSSKSYLGNISVFLFLIFNLILKSSSAYGDTIALDDVLSQPHRPTVKQVISLLESGWQPSPLYNATELPKDPTHGIPELQNDFPTWYNALMSGAPQMIASFESAFPGAVWAFVGRDMAVLADLFEAFYLSIGQENRVTRIHMSRPTLENIDPEWAVDYMRKKGFDPNQLEVPFILVDAISKGGGRQVRYLLHSVYTNHKRLNKSPSELLPYFNSIGLLVSTSNIEANSLLNAHEVISKEIQRYDGESSENVDFYRKHKIFTYYDGRQSNSYVSTNESGYVHWVGAWHDSYGPIDRKFHRVESPRPLAQFPGTKTFVLNYQAHFIRETMTKEFLNLVKGQAGLLGYEFPIVRPEYVASPIKKFSSELQNALTVASIRDKLTDFEKYDLQRTPSEWISEALIHHLSTHPFSFESLITLFQSQWIRKQPFNKNVSDAWGSLGKNKNMLKILASRAQTEEDFAKFKNYTRQEYLSYVILEVGKCQTIDRWFTILKSVPKNQRSDLMGGRRLEKLFDLDPKAKDVEEALSLLKSDKTLVKKLKSLAKDRLSENEANLFRESQERIPKWWHALIPKAWLKGRK